MSGVWAVGNVADPKALVITAAGQGAAAAFALNLDLVAEDVERAMAADHDPAEDRDHSHPAPQPALHD